MATDKCPKCGAEKHCPPEHVFPFYKCGSSDCTGMLIQSEGCRIVELEAENAKLRAAGDALAVVAREAQSAWIVVKPNGDAYLKSANVERIGVLFEPVLAAWNEAKGNQ